MGAELCRPPDDQYWVRNWSSVLFAGDLGRRLPGRPAGQGRAGDASDRRDGGRAALQTRETTPATRCTRRRDRDRHGGRADDHDRCSLAPPAGPRGRSPAGGRVRPWGPPEGRGPLSAVTPEPALAQHVERFATRLQCAGGGAAARPTLGSRSLLGSPDGEARRDQFAAASLLGEARAGSTVGVRGSASWPRPLRIHGRHPGEGHRATSNGTCVPPACSPRDPLAPRADAGHGSLAHEDPRD